MRPQTYMMEQIRSELESAVGAPHCLTELTDRMAYSTDYFWVPRVWIDRGQPPALPDFVVLPGSPEEVSRVLRIAARYRIPVIPWGGGSGTQGGALPVFGGITLDLKRLDRIIDIDTQSLVVTAQAGVNGEQLEWALNARGITLAHYPASRRCATLGGYLSARGSGVLSTKYGKAEDMVLSMQVVLPSGEIIRTAPTRSHAAGPDLNQVFSGAEGTLGVITEATMRCDPMPEVRIFRAYLFQDLHEALEAGRRIMTSRLEPSVLRLYDEGSTRSILKQVLGVEAAGCYLVVVFEGIKEMAETQMALGRKLCESLGGKDLGEAPGKHWWEHRYDFYFPTLTFDLPQMFGTMDTVTTFARIEALYLDRKRTLSERFGQLGLRYIAHFSHWYPWGVMLYDRFIVDSPPRDATEAIQLHNRIWRVAVETALRHGGVLNEHHGIGLKLGPYMHEQYGPAFKVLQTLKDGLDPYGVLNPGKLGFGSPR